MDIDEAVSNGACVQAAIIKDKIDLDLVDVVALDLGVECEGDHMSVLVQANSELPCEKTRQYTTVVDNQTEVDICVRQGQSTKASDNKQLGLFSIVEIDPAPKGQPKIEVTFALDADGLLSVRAIDERGKEQKIQINNPALDKKEVERAIKEINLSEEERKEVNVERAELSRAIAEVEEIVESLPAKESKKMQNLLLEGKKELEDVKAKKMQKTSKKIKEFLDEKLEDEANGTEG